MRSRTLLSLCFSLLSTAGLFLNAQAQTPGEALTRTQFQVRANVPWVTASAGAEQVRFLAPGEIAQMRLEVFILGGAQLYDSDFKAGNLFDWDLRDRQGQRLADGAYRCLLTIKDVTGRTSQRQGLLLVQGNETAWQPAEQAEAAFRAANPSDAAERIELFASGSNEPGLSGAALAHDGNQGRLMTSDGALSFRTGDFRTGKDQEQMRLTAEGKLGLGVSEPQAKLDVAGAIRTAEGIVFPDGTVQTTAYVASGRSLSSLSERSAVQRDDAGRTLAEITEPTQKNSAGGGLGPPVKTNIPDDLVLNGNLNFTPAGARDINIQNNSGGLRFYGAPTLTTSPAAAAIQFWGNNSGFPGQLYLDAGAHNSAALIFRTAPTGGTIAERMRVTASGNVGIGTLSPNTAQLAVVDTGNAISVQGETNSTIPFAIGVFGRVNSTTPGSFSSGVRGLNNGTSSNGIGVWGEQLGSGYGVYGTAPSGIGVYGHHTGSTGTAPGVQGETSSADDGAFGVLGLVNSTAAGAGSAGVRGINSGTAGNGAGVHGSHASGGDGVYGSSTFGAGVHGLGSNVGVWAQGGGTTSTALQISNGAIKVTGAGVGSSTPVFLHTTHRSGPSFNMGYFNKTTVLDNPYTNGNPNAILFVTVRNGSVPSGVAAIYDSSAGYSPTSNRWVIVRMDGFDIDDLVQFAVLVVKP